MAKKEANTIKWQTDLEYRIIIYVSLYVCVYITALLARDTSSLTGLVKNRAIRKK